MGNNGLSPERRRQIAALAQILTREYRECKNAPPKITKFLAAKWNLAPDMAQCRWRREAGMDSYPSLLPVEERTR